jgi:predicted phosphodiesterase
VPSGGLDWDDTPAAPTRRLRKALVMSDLHVPHVSHVAVDCARQVAADVQPDTVIIDGDFLDAAALSSYAKNPRGTPTMEDEFAAGNDLLDDIDTWGFTHKYHVGGNHLAGRWTRYMWERAPALTGLVHFEDLLRFKERGWKCVDYKDHLFFGSALISHEIGRGGATAMARTRDDIHNDCVIGHVHRAGVHWRGDVMGRTFFGASFGWMGDLNAVDYAHKASVSTTHVLGFGLLTLDEETGQTFVEAIPVIDGRCVAHGKLYVSRVACPKTTRKVA